MPKSSTSSAVLKDGKISAVMIEDIVATALQNLKTLMVDYETPIEIRIQIALKIFEIFGTDSHGITEGEIIKRGVERIEKNAQQIEMNAHRLSHVETLLELVARQRGNIGFQQEALSGKKERIIPHEEEE